MPTRVQETHEGQWQHIRSDSDHGRLIEIDLQLIGKLLITAVLAVWAVRQGFFRAPGVFLSWPMFAHTAAYRAELHCDATQERIVPWDYMIHLDYLGLPQHLAEFLDYLQERHSTTVSGEGVFATRNGYSEFTVRGSRVATH